MIALLQRRVGALRADPYMREMARAALSSVGIRSLGMLLIFVFNVMLARLLGMEGAGLFFLALSVVLVAEAIGRFGLEYSLVRFVSAAHARQDWSAVSGVWRHALGLGVAVSVLMTILVVVFAAPVADQVFGKPGLRELLLTLSFAIVPLALTKLYAAALRGMSHFLIFRLLQNALPLALVIALLIPLDMQFGKAHGAALSYVIGWMIALGIGWWSWRVVAESIPAVPPVFERARLLASCAPMLAVTLSVLLLTQMPVFFIGIWSDTKEVAIFNVTVRIALLGAFLLHSMVSIFLPRFSELIASGRLADLKRVSGQSIMLVALCVIPLWVAVLLFPAPILTLFGEEFRQGAAVLIVTFTGQMLFGIFGVGGEILLMGGHEHLVRRINFMSLLLCFASCLLFVRDHGAMGAAVAISLAYVGHAAMCLFHVRKNFGFWLMPSFGGNVK
ncbi:MAG TPA: oligosaccharide flippase family protein [Gallionella sp.]|nr:oligosaccharide flippase family protein [Gallionella sp.]